MKHSTEFVAALVIIGVGFGVMRFIPADRPIRGLLFALVLTVGGGVMAFLRSRRAANHR